MSHVEREHNTFAKGNIEYKRILVPGKKMQPDAAANQKGARQVIYVPKRHQGYSIICGPGDMKLIANGKAIGTAVLLKLCASYI